MIAKELKLDRYEKVLKKAKDASCREPFSAIYGACLVVNDSHYELKYIIYKRKIVALQAVKTDHDETGTHYELITDNLILSALLELFLFDINA